MARYDDPFDDDEPFDYGSLPPAQQRSFLYDLIGFKESPQDNEAHELFWEVMYNDELSRSERQDLYDQLLDMIWDEYGIDFDSVWDWEEFRKWY